VNPAFPTPADDRTGNSPVTGQQATAIPTLNVTAPGAGSPTGTVTFKDGATTLGTGTLSTSAGVTTASFPTSTLSTASHSITATYGGGREINTNGGSLPPVVNPAATTTSLSSSANPSVSGQSVSPSTTLFRSAPGAGSPTGTVTFKDGAATLGTGTLSTSAGVTTASFPTGTLSTA